MSYHREAQYMANLIEIKKAEMSEKESYKRIFDNSQLYNHYFKKGDNLDLWLTEFIKNGEGFVAVDRNGEPVGWMSLRLSDERVDNLPSMTLLAVKDNQRGKGIGQMLIKFYEGVLSGLGFKEGVIMVNDWNPRARKLYDSLGYRFRKNIDDPFIPGQTILMLVKKLR